MLLQSTTARRLLDVAAVYICLVSLQSTPARRLPDVAANSKYCFTSGEVSESEARSVPLLQRSRARRLPDNPGGSQVQKLPWRKRFSQKLHTTD